MTDTEIMNRFAKCGDQHHLSRRFHNLGRDAKAFALSMIRDGIDPKRAIDRARRRTAVSSQRSAVSGGQTAISDQRPLFAAA